MRTVREVIAALTNEHPSAEVVVVVNGQRFVIAEIAVTNPEMLPDPEPYEVVLELRAGDPANYQ